MSSGYLVGTERKRWCPLVTAWSLGEGWSYCRRRSNRQVTSLGLEGQKDRGCQVRKGGYLISRPARNRLECKVSRMLRGGGSGRVAPWRGLLWDPFVKVNVRGCVIVRSRLFNGAWLFFLFSIVPFVAQPIPTNDTLESNTKICAVEESQGRKKLSCDCGPNHKSSCFDRWCRFDESQGMVRWRVSEQCPVLILLRWGKKGADEKRSPMTK